MKKVYVRTDTRNRVCLTKVLKEPYTSFYAYEQKGKIILEPVIDLPAHEAWLYKPENKEILAKVKRALKQKGTIDRGSFAKYVKSEKK